MGLGIENPVHSGEDWERLSNLFVSIQERIKSIDRSRSDLTYMKGALSIYDKKCMGSYRDKKDVLEYRI